VLAQRPAIEGGPSPLAAASPSWEPHHLVGAQRRRRRSHAAQRGVPDLSWSDDHRDGCEAWFDRQMKALEEFEVTVTFCFTPEHKGVVPHYTSPPREIGEFVDFCARMVRRYGS
jgi:hypothetical protein